MQGAQMSDQNIPAKNPLYQIFMLALSIYVLAALVLEEFFVTDLEVRAVLQHIDLWVCLFFLTDFFVSLYRAPSKREYMKWGWIDLLSSIPMVDPLRWGRLARIVRIIRALRTLRELRVLGHAIRRSRMQSLTVIVVLFSFVTYTLCAGLILGFERGHPESISTANEALWWAFLNVMNAKVSISAVYSTGGAVTTVVLNKVGLLLFAYFNAIIVAWLLNKRTEVRLGRAQ